LSVQLSSCKSRELVLRLEATVPGRNVASAVGNEIREAVIKELEAQGI
jgi:hypothetical protein